MTGCQPKPSVYTVQEQILVYCKAASSGQEGGLQKWGQDPVQPGQEDTDREDQSSKEELHWKPETDPASVKRDLKDITNYRKPHNNRTNKYFYPKEKCCI